MQMWYVRQPHFRFLLRPFICKTQDLTRTISLDYVLLTSTYTETAQKFADTYVAAQHWLSTADASEAGPPVAFR
jgi:hypothetical protein